MGALIDVNTDGLAKLGEVISYGLGLTAFGRKKMADAESYAAIKQAETNTQVELIKQKGAEEIANYGCECQSQYWLRLNISHRAQTT